MVKRQGKRASGEPNIPEAISVLHRGLTCNPTSAQITQSWGLAELQRGNDVGAVKLLERSVELNPSFAPVLEWQIVKDASARAKVLIAERRDRNDAVGRSL